MFRRNFELLLKVLWLMSLVQAREIKIIGYDRRRDGSNRATAPRNSNKNVTIGSDEFREDPDCKDLHHDCTKWAQEGACNLNPKYMLQVCPISCQSCPLLNQQVWDDKPQKVFGKETRDKIEETKIYMTELLQLENHNSHDDLRLLRRYCRNQNAMCSYMSSKGDCDKNANFMHISCAPACQTCRKKVRLEQSMKVKTSPTARHPKVLLMKEKQKLQKQ